jgi:formate C-acetyltransferase
MSRGGSFISDMNPFLRDVALYRAMAPGRSRVQVRAAFLHELVKLAPLEIGPGWQLAGEHLLAKPHTPFGFQSESAPAEAHFFAELGVAPAEIDEVRQAVERWGTMRGEAIYYAVGQVAPENALGQGNYRSCSPEMIYDARGWQENHSIRDYEKVLRGGFRRIRQEVEERLDAADMTDKDYVQRENFWRAALSVCDAGILLGQRYADLAAHLAEGEADPRQRQALEEMAAQCRRVPAEGARSFREAVQSLWLAHILTCGEDHINANSLGRLDQILYPWYEADLAAGRLTRAEAVEIMAELACKLYLNYDVQAITLGGLDAQGHDAVNDLSYVILDATEQVDFIRDLSVRLHRDSPSAFLHRVSELIARGGGIPYIFNDDCFVPALTDRGITLEDARNYAPIGCIELTIPGRANPHAVSGWFNAAKCLELALFDGQEPSTGKQLGPRTGTLADHASFEALMAAYFEQVEFFARRMVYHCNRGELMQRERGPLPCWSTLTDDCIARGRDITDGGAVYNYHAICFMGTADVADALMAVKRLVYEEGRLDPQALLQALREDFQGHEPLRQILLKGAPKYGNDESEVDDLAQRITSHFIQLMDAMQSPLNGRYVVHLFTFKLNIAFGKTTGALPDGRRRSEPLAYSLSAHQGRDVNGVTALLTSLSRLPHDQAAGATAAIVDLDPKLVDEQGPTLVAQLIQSALEMGVGQLQWNVVSAERLRLAQRDPERYGNIAVRVAGYSQKFKLIDRELQDHIIARTKHSH